MKKQFFSNEKDGFYGTYYENPKGANCAMIGLFGDDPNDFMAKCGAKWLHKNDVNVMCMSPDVKNYGHVNFPLERIETAIKWLKSHGNKKIGIMGMSTAGMDSLVAASYFPDITLTFGLTPSDFVWQGFEQGEKDGCKEWPIPEASTLLHILACIDSYQSGEYTIDGTLVKNLSEGQYAQIRNEKIGIVMQDFALVEDFSALENVLIPLDFAKKKIKNKKEKALEALKAVGMGDLSKKPCNKLSGGQKQRVAIARAIVNEPAMILADEPTGALDTKTSAEIMELFKRLNKEGKTVVIVTHDPKVAEQCSRVIEVSDGKII